MKRSVLLVGLLLIAVAVSSSTGAQAPDSDCVAATVWHLQQALKVDLLSEQDYHLKAAEAAEGLASQEGAPCAEWQAWADGSGLSDNQVAA